MLKLIKQWKTMAVGVLFAALMLGLSEPVRAGQPYHIEHEPAKTIQVEPEPAKKFVIFTGNATKKCEKGHLERGVVESYVSKSGLGYCHALAVANTLVALKKVADPDILKPLEHLMFLTYPKKRGEGYTRKGYKRWVKHFKKHNPSYYDLYGHLRNDRTDEEFYQQVLFHLIEIFREFADNSLGKSHDDLIKEFLSTGNFTFYQSEAYERSK